MENLKEQLYTNSKSKQDLVFPKNKIREEVITLHTRQRKNN